ncbi:MAG: hypothetical protein M5R41_18905 [Bacteroidia bacterium]|nr:hypothetical protein [Bacteroidia bacterium]
MKRFALSILTILTMLSYNHTLAQSLRLGVGAMPVPYVLRVQGLGSGMAVSTADDFTITLLAEADITPVLTLGMGIQPRAGRSFTLQFDTDGRHIGWWNTQHAQAPHYQTAFAISEGVEIPLSLRYRLSGNALTPFIRAEYCLAMLDGDGYAVRYLTKGGDISVISDVEAARTSSTVHAMSVTIGLETRANPWFSFVVDLGWRHTFTDYVNEDFMRVRELDTITGRLTLMATVVEGW